jgi:hypothetical protein
MDTYPDTFAFVQMHYGDSYGTSFGNSRWSFYQCTGTPTSIFDGLLKRVGSQSYTTYRNDYLTRWGAPTDVTIQVGALPPDTQTTEIHAEVCIESGGSTKTMRVYMVEVLDHYPSTALWHRNCFRQAASTQTVTLAPGECQEIVRTFSFNSSPDWANKEDMKIIVWAQKPQTFWPAEVYNAAVMPWPFTPWELYGDFDDDDDIDEVDATMFIDTCFTGPGGGVPPGCEVGDFDRDDDIDCDDWAAFKLAWTGPPEYPPFFVDCDEDCNGNSIADEWDIESGASEDCNGNGIPDDCILLEVDCNSNLVPDYCDIVQGTSADCNINTIPDECDLADGTSPDCNTNDVPDECDLAGGTSEDCNTNLVPDSCDIAEGTSQDLNSTLVPDECECAPPWAEDSMGVTCVEHNECGVGGEARCLNGTCYVPKHRYISIAGNPEQVTNTARRICIEGFCLGWVGAPYDSNGITLADVVAAPVYADIDFVGDWPELVNVTGCKIATGQNYQIETIQYGQDIGDEHMYSDPLELRTPTKWGDVVGTCPGEVCSPPQGIANLDDIMAKIKRFQAVPVAPITWLDDDPSDGDETPNQTINLGDIMVSIHGFQGEPYPGLGPMDCP